MEQPVSETDPYNRPRHPLLIVLSGPSGVGKDSVLAGLEKTGLPFHFVVTANTRPRRPGEIEGQDYHFVSMSEFTEMIEQGELLEYAVVYGDYKGIPKQQVRQALASGQDVIMRLDVQGAMTIRRLVPEAVLIFLMAGSEEELMARLHSRQTETPDTLKLRIVTAREELKRLDEFDYIVLNRAEALDETVEAVVSIICAEHCRVHQRQVTL
ncbi:MAG TPA: guanylate kinase [Anaerolineae bacterium]